MDENKMDEYEDLQVVEDPDYNPPPPIKEYPRWHDETPPRTPRTILLGCLLWIVLIWLGLAAIAVVITFFQHINKTAPLLGLTLLIAFGLLNFHGFMYRKRH